MTLIKHSRLARKLLLKEAAAVLGTDPGNLSRIEQGAQQPSLALARKISATYGLTLDQVFDNPRQEAA